MTTTRTGVEGAGWASLTDDALIAGVVVGDESAVDELLARYQGRVYGAAMTIVGDRALAQEIAQDTFVRVWRHAATYDIRRGAVHSWVMRIVHNLCVDALRVRRPVAVDPFTLLDLTDPVGGPASAAEDRSVVRSALASVPAEQARAVLLAAMYGYDAQTISELDGIPLGTAKTRIRLGLEKLRVRLDVGEEEVR